MKTNHTPGPWTSDPEGEIAITIEDATGHPICDVHGAANNPVTEANARLIAAAPDLLALAVLVSNGMAAALGLAG